MNFTPGTLLRAEVIVSFGNPTAKGKRTTNAYINGNEVIDPECEGAMAAWIILALCVIGDLEPEARTPSALHLRIDQDGRLSGDQLRVVVEEIDRVWRAAGVRVSSGRSGDAVPEARTVVSMRILMTPPPIDRQVLGFVTTRVHDEVTPTIFISLTAVRDLIDGSLRSQAIVVRDRLLAQAIGRVAAHELGHYLFRQRIHDEHGLMRPTYLARDLISPSLKPFRIVRAKGRD